MQQLLSYILIHLSFLSCTTIPKPQTEMLSVIPENQVDTDARSISIYWIRHGYSCANAVQDVGGWQKYLHTLVKDPLLTDTGIENAAAIGTQLQEKDIQPDLVLCSNLKRAMETARYLFPEHDVISVPYVGETGLGFDNTPSSFKKLLEFKASHSYDHLDITFWNDHDIKSNDYGPDLDKFYVYLQETLLENPDIKSIAVITHSNFLKENLTPIKGNNNSVWKKMYTFTEDHFLIEDDDNIDQIHSGCNKTEADHTRWQCEDMVESKIITTRCEK